MEKISNPRNNWKMSAKLYKLWKFNHQKKFGRNAHPVPRVRIQNFELISNPAVSYYAYFLCVIKGLKAADIWRCTEDVPESLQWGIGESEYTCISNTSWINLVALNLNLEALERKSWSHQKLKLEVTAGLGSGRGQCL